MHRIRAFMGLASLLGLGTATAMGGPFMTQYWNKGTPDGIHWGPSFPSSVPTVQGAWGEPVELQAPYNAKPPNGTDAARAMLAQSMPLDLIQQSGYFKNSSYPITPVAAQCPGGVCAAPGMGGMGGIGGPGSPITPPGIPALGAMPPGIPRPAQPPGAVAAVGALTGGAPTPFPIQRTEVRFAGPAGMKISWYGPSADGKPGFGPQYLEAPARYNFLQASIYRLKLSNIPNRPGVELYPTLEVVPSNSKTCTFLAHSAVPISFNEEDFEQVASGNFVVKVIYLPDPQFQDLAATGPDEVVSSRLEPGVDPIVEAKRRGSILLVVRLGNIDLEAPNTPAMDAPNPFSATPSRPQAMMPGMPMQPGLPGINLQPGMPGMPGMPNVPGMAGQAPLPGMPNQMAPGMPMRPPMVPYGMLNNPSMMPGLPNTSLNQGQTPPVPTAPGLPNLPGMLPPSGAQLPGQPGVPVGQSTSSSGVQTVQYQPATPRKPTLAELAAPQTSANNYNSAYGSR
jgi:hypothetical protein